MSSRPSELHTRPIRLADAFAALAMERKWSHAQKKNYIVQEPFGDRFPGLPQWAEPHLQRRKLPVHRRVLDAGGWLVVGVVGYFLLYARQTHIMVLELYTCEALIIVLCLILVPSRKSRT